MNTIFKDISIVIAAAGKGTRANLPYPKCLFKIEGKEILMRIVSLFPRDLPINIIVSKDGFLSIQQFFDNNNIQNRNLLVQNEQNGMGDAVLQINKIKDTLNEHILLLWGDLPFIRRDSISQLVKIHFKENNTFSLLTLKTSEAYTHVKRDKNNNITGVIETRELANTCFESNTNERDLGVFIFNKELILQFLTLDLDNKYGAISGEHGFLYIISHLVKAGYKVGSYESKFSNEGISLNSLSDLRDFI